MFNIPIERITLDVHPVFTGAERPLKVVPNYECMVAEFKHNYFFNFNSKKVSLIIKPTLHIHFDSFLHKVLCQFAADKKVEVIKDGKILKTSIT